MSDYKVTDTELTSVANAIRTKGGTSAQLEWPTGFVSAINAISPSGGGGDFSKDTSFLSSSTVANILCSSDISDYTIPSVEGATSELSITPFDYTCGLYVDLSGANTDVTCYCVGKRVGTRTGEAFILSVPADFKSGNDPLFDIADVNGTIIYSVYAGNITVNNKSGLDDHIYAISIDGQTKKARYFIDGEYLGEKEFTNSGSYVAFAKGSKTDTRYDGDFRLKYVGVVSEFESDETVIANMQTIMTKLGMSS